MIVSSRRLPARATIAPWKCWLALPRRLFVVGGGRGFALFHCRADRCHALGAAAAADGAHFNGAAHRVDVVDVAGLQAGHEDPPVRVADHQALGRQFGESLPDRVPGNAQVLRDGRFREPGSRQQQALRQLQAQLGRHPVRHGRNRHTQPGRRAQRGSRCGVSLLPCRGSGRRGLMPGGKDSGSCFGAGHTPEFTRSSHRWIEESLNNLNF